MMTMGTNVPGARSAAGKDIDGGLMGGIWTPGGGVWGLNPRKVRLVCLRTIHGIPVMAGRVC